MGLFLHFLGSSGLFLMPFRASFVTGVRFKVIFLGPSNVDYQFWFWKYSPIFLFFIGQFLALFALFGLFAAIFGVGVRFKNFFGTYLCKQLTEVLEVQPYLFVFDSATF